MRVGSSAGLVAVLASSLVWGACSNPESKTLLRPEGPPEIRQLFVIDNDGVSKMAYGLHPDILDEDPTDPVIPIYANQAGPVNNAIVGAGQRIRIVMDELLEGGTLEMFACACFHLDGSGCAETSRGFVFEPGTTVDPTRCTTCEDDPVTTDINETGLCADINFDGVPDDAFLLPDVISLDCGVATVTNTEDQGWWNPSGNQLIPVLGGTNALGPAVVFNPAGLPTNADCTVSLASTVVDKDGNSVANDPAAPGTPTFHTEPMVMIVSSPADGQTGVPIASEVALTFNVELLATLDATSIDVVDMTTTTAVTGTAALDPSDPATLVFTPDAALVPNTTYQVTAKTGAQGVRDSFGSSLPQDEVFTFTTGAM